MPWCEPCEKSWTPTSLNNDGTCPQCGETVEGTGHISPVPHRAPWHFKLMVVSIAVYLAYRLLQLVIWAF